MSQTLAKPGAFRVLLWKEWRQQRWTLFGMTALGLALFVAGGCLEKRWSFVLSGAAFLLVLLGIPLVLSARAFAGEDEDGTAAFLRELPFPAMDVFIAKFLVVVLASWGAAGLVLVLGPLWPGYPDNALGVVPWATRALPVRGESAALAGIWLLAPVAAAQASLLASMGIRSLTTALLSGVCLCFCVPLGAVSVYLLDLLQARGFVWLLVAASVPAAGALLAGLLSARRHPRRLVQSVRGTGGCAAAMAVFLLPGALSVLYLAALARPEAYVRPSWWRGSLGGVTAIAPSSARPTAILLACERRSGEGAALALLDPATGRAAWLDSNSLCSAREGVQTCRGMWSPDGSRVAWAGSGRSGLAAISWRGGWVCVHDLTTGRTTRVHGQAPAFPFLAGSDMWGVSADPWYDSTWMAGPSFLHAGVGVGFVNTADGSTHVCPLPSAAATVPWMGWRGTVVVPGGAVFTAVRRPAAKDAVEELVIARCTPSSTEATLVRVSDLPPSTDQLRAVSADAKWALFGPRSWNNQASGQSLVDLDTGARRQVVLPPEVTNRLAVGGCPPRVIGFARHGTQLLVGVDDALALYDPQRDTWQVHSPPTPAAVAAYSGEWAPSPDGTHLMQVQVFRARGSPSVVQVFDMGSAQWTAVPLGERSWCSLQWFGNEHLLVMPGGNLWLLGLDGSREVLWPRE